MALCNECFEDFVHPLTHKAIEKNKAIRARFGRHARWDWDDEAVTLTFSDSENSTLVIDVTIVGTTQAKSWQWSWSNSNLSAKEKGDMERVREFGESRGYEQLTSKFLEADEYTGWEMTAVAAHVVDGLGTYRFPTDQGHCYLVYRNIRVIPKHGADLYGAMQGTVEIAPGADRTEPTGEMWKAEQDDYKGCC